MKNVVQIVLLMLILWWNSLGALTAQDVPGLTHCLLFDTRLEKEAFESSKQNNCDPLIFLLAGKADSAFYENVNGALERYVINLQAKRGKFDDDLEFLAHAFRDVHRKFLKRYTYPESFVGIFDDGSFNCVSGTALFACLLDRLGYQPRLFETRYHVFLRVDLYGTPVLLESTDAQNGIVIGKDQVSGRIDDYIESETSRLNANQTTSAPFHRENVLREIDLTELSGLHYYNIAVNFINESDHHNALRALKKAELLYPGSQRIRQLAELARFEYDAKLSEFNSQSISN